MDKYTTDQIIQRLDTIIYQLNQLTEALTEPIEDEQNDNPQDKTTARQ